MPPPAPKRIAYPFQTLGSPAADLTIEVFASLQCPSCKKSFPTVLALPTLFPGRVKVIYHPHVLYTQTNSFVAAKAAFAVAKQQPDKFFDFIGYIYERQAEYGQAVADSKTQAEVKGIFAEFVTAFGGDAAAFTAALDSDAVVNDVKDNQRASILKQVWSTPTYVINGVEVTTVGSSTTLEEWEKVLGALLA